MTLLKIGGVRMPDANYLNIPIELLAGAMDNIESTCERIIKYSIYNRCLTLGHGSDKSKLEDAAAYLGMEIPYKPGYLQELQKIYQSVTNHKVKTGIKRHLIFEFRDEPKTESEIIVFIAFCALSGNPGETDHSKPEQTDHLRGWRQHPNFAGEDFQFCADFV